MQEKKMALILRQIRTQQNWRFFLFQREVDDLRTPNFFRKQASMHTTLNIFFKILGMVRHSWKK